jgi:hypothetical protein
MTEYSTNTPSKAASIKENPKKATIRIIIAVIGVLAFLAIIFASYVYPSIIYKNDVDIWNGVSLKYSNADFFDIVWGNVARYHGPLSGYSQPSVQVQQPISNNIEVNDFYKNITYKVNYGYVKDSQKLVVTAQVSPDILQRDRIRIKGDINRTFTISLPKLATSYSQLSQKAKKTLNDVSLKWEPTYSLQNVYAARFKQQPIYALSESALNAKYGNGSLMLFSIYKLKKPNSGLGVTYRYFVTGFYNIIIDHNGNFVC